MKSAGLSWAKRKLFAKLMPKIKVKMKISRTEAGKITLFTYGVPQQADTTAEFVPGEDFEYLNGDKNLVKGTSSFAEGCLTTKTTVTKGMVKGDFENNLQVLVDGTLESRVTTEKGVTMTTIFMKTA